MTILPISNEIMNLDNDHLTLHAPDRNGFHQNISQSWSEEGLIIPVYKKYKRAEEHVTQGYNGQIQNMGNAIAQMTRFL